MVKPTVYQYDTYREELGKAYSCLGYALWDPDPGQYPHVRVGDVGFTRGGKFHRLFNTLLSEDDPSHQSLRYGVPEHYEQLQISLPDHIDFGTLRPSDLHSYGVTIKSGGLAATVPVTGSTVSAKVSFSCKEKHGAVLSLPVDSLREDTLAVDHFREWIAKHIDSWFALTKTYRLGVKMEDLVLVTGCHRTRSWSNLAFKEVRENTKFSLKVDVAGTLGASIRWKSSKLNVPGALHNHGPSGEDLPENQCIFVRGFRVKRILGKFHQIKGAAEAKPDPSEEDYEPEAEREVISIPSVSKYRDPLHVLLDYIVKRAPHCDIALVHDDDLQRIRGTGDSTSQETLQLDMMDYLERLTPKIVSMSHSLPVNAAIPRTDTGYINVAMLSAHLGSLATTNRPSSIPLLSQSHFSAGTMNREESVEDDAPGGYPPSELEPPAASQTAFSEPYGGLAYLTHARSHTDNKKRAVPRLPSSRSSRQSTHPIKGKVNPQPSGSKKKKIPQPSIPPLGGLGHDMLSPYLSSSKSSDDNSPLTTSISSTSRPKTYPSYYFTTNIYAALRSYGENTRKSLISHPLTARLRACDPAAILTVLQDQAGQLDRPRGGEESLPKLLNPTVNVLYALSQKLGDFKGRVFSPTTAIFAGFGILLLAAKDAHVSQEDLIDVFERMGFFFKRLEIYTEVRATDSMTDIAVKILVEVLNILAIATKELDRERTQKHLKKLTGRLDLEGGMERLDKLTQEQARMASVELLRISLVDNKQTVGDAVKCVKGKVRVDDKTAAVDEKGIWTQIRANLMKWQSPPDPSTNHNIECGRHHFGTAKWFFEEVRLKEWKVSGSLMWIHGKPGSGKSVLCSAIINDIATMCEVGSASMAYFYFDSRDVDKRFLHNLLSSLLIQLSDASDLFCDILFRVYVAHQNGKRMPSDDTLRQCLKEMLTLPGHGPIYIIVDALNECPDSSGLPPPRSKVLQLIKELVDLQLPHLRLCVTSRLEVDIRASLEPLASHGISLHDHIGQQRDIADYVRSIVYSDPSSAMREWSEADKEHVIETLSERANGMFRWVFYQLKALRHCLPQDIPRVLGELPDSLDETYERVLKQIMLVNQSHAYRLFQCLAVAIRPLRVEELAEVVALDFDSAQEGLIPTPKEDWRWGDKEEAILSTCSSLIDIVDDDSLSHNRVVQFAHFSVRDFLTSDRLATSGGDVSCFHIRLELAHTAVAQACLGILLHSINSDNNERVGSRSPLAAYASRHWVDHAQFDGVSPRIIGGMRLLFDPAKPHFAAWLQLHDTDDGWYQFRDYDVTEPTTTPLYYASLCGFHDLSAHLISEYPQHINARGGLNHSPLVAALHKRHFDVAELLYQHGAAVDITGYGRQTPLHAASVEGLADVAQWLLDHGADANSVEESDSTPLNLAAENGHLAVVRMLLKHGVDVNAANDDDHTPLHRASKNGHLETVRLLLEHGAQIDAYDWSHSTPLHHASFGPSAETVRLLIEHGADVSAKNDSLSTPLHLASSGGQTKTVRLLIDHGADVKAPDENDSRPLHLASSAGSVEIAQLLVEQVADVGPQDKSGSTPLHLASSAGSVETVQLLVEHGAYVHAQDKSGSTPLHLASSAGSVETVQLLVKHGADVHAQDENGSTPLHLASYAGSVETVWLLVEHGADVNAWGGESHSTPLHLASSAGSVETVRLLVEYGANVNTWDLKGLSTPLHLASSAGSVETAQLLVEHGADVHARNMHLLTPLHLASSAGSVETVQLLVEHGADVNTRDFDLSSTPLHLASSAGSIETVRLLIEHGANVGAKDNEGQTPYQIARSGIHPNHGEIAQLLSDQTTPNQRRM